MSRPWRSPGGGFYATRSTARFGVRDARLALSATVAIVRALAGGQESFPRNAGRIVDPGFFRLRVTAVRLSLLDDSAASVAQAVVDFVQLVPVLNLNAKVIQAHRTAARRNG